MSAPEVTRRTDYRPPQSGEPSRTGQQASEWRIGTEHEKFAYRTSDLRPLPYDGPDGISELLNRMTRFGWEPVTENGNVIALTSAPAMSAWRPGGRSSCPGAPLETLHDTCAEFTSTGSGQTDRPRAWHRHDRPGLQSKWKREDIPWMPKGRYKIMREYMPKRGSLGLDMMMRTCTVQVNLDFASEADMVKKFRVSLALQPIATALFANSPLRKAAERLPELHAAISGPTPTRTAAATCRSCSRKAAGVRGLRAGCADVLRLPRRQVHRRLKPGFRDFLQGKLPALPGELPLMTDWADHLTTLFPEVRLKRYLEMRGADGDSWRGLCALPALWVGLLYDGQALDAAWDLVKDWTDESAPICGRRFRATRWTRCIAAVR